MDPALVAIESALVTLLICRAMTLQISVLAIPPANFSLSRARFGNLSVLNDNSQYDLHLPESFRL
jgi:hypothetical protein